MSLRNGRPRMWRLLASSVTAIGLILVLLTPTLANAATAKVAQARCPHSPLAGGRNLLQFPAQSPSTGAMSGPEKSCFWLEQRLDNPLLFESAPLIRLRSSWYR